MSNQCVCCGSSIPNGQRTCSMCYGDPGHGRDGYYQRWLEEREREAEQRRECEAEAEAEAEAQHG